MIYSEQNENKLWGDSEFLSCPQYDVIWYWSFRNPHTVVMEEMVNASWGGGDNFLPLEEVTNLTIHEFYEIYLDPETDFCVEGGVDVE